MKTQLRIRSLRILAVSATVAASLNIAVLAQPSLDRTSLALTSTERLEIFADHSEATLIYVAPTDLAIENEKIQALENIELFAATSANNLKYSAPEESENQYNQELDALADDMIVQLEYRAPVYDEFTNTFDKPVMTTLKSNSRPVVADKVSTRETWLINAGYYKSSGKSLNHKLRADDLAEKKYTNKL